MGENKTAVLDNLFGKFLKDRVTVLAKPISQICNLSKTYSIFSSDCKIAKLKPLFKKGSKRAPKLLSKIPTPSSFQTNSESYS